MLSVYYLSCIDAYPLDLRYTQHLRENRHRDHEVHLVLNRQCRPARRAFALQFSDPSQAEISYTARVLAWPGAR